LNPADQLAHFDGRPFLGDDLQKGAADRGRYFGIHLIGGHFTQGFIFGDPVPRFFQPTGNRSLCHALPQLGHRYIGSHILPPFPRMGPRDRMRVGRHQNSASSRMAAATFSGLSMDSFSRGGLYGIAGTSGPQRRRTGASSSKKASSVMRAETSPPTPPVLVSS